MRVLVQPAVAIVLGIMDGCRDSHRGSRPVGVDFRSRRGRDRWSYQGAVLRRIILPLCMAIVLSMLFQAIIRREVRPGPALAFAVVFVALPYVVVRGFANRVDRRWHRTHPRKASA